MAVLLAAADTYVVVVALPSIMSGVGVGLDRLQRATPIISGFLLGYVAVLPLIGRLADLAGTDPVFAGCLAAFGVGSVVTATAHALPVVIAGRALQGLGGGGLVPVTLAMVAARWPPDARGLPLGIVGAVQELGSVDRPPVRRRHRGRGVVAGHLLDQRAGDGGARGRVLAHSMAAVSIGLVPAGRGRPSRRAPPSRRGPPSDVVGRLGAAVPTWSARSCWPWPPRLCSSGSTPRRAWPTAPTSEGPGPGGPRGPGRRSPLRSCWWPPAALVAFLGWERLAPKGFRVLVPIDRVWSVLAQADLPGALILAAALGCGGGAVFHRRPEQGGGGLQRARPRPGPGRPHGVVLVARAPGEGPADRSRGVRGPPGVGRAGRQPGGRSGPGGGVGRRPALRPLHGRPVLGGVGGAGPVAIPRGRSHRCRRRRAAVPPADAGARGRRRRAWAWRRRRSCS